MSWGKYQIKERCDNCGYMTVLKVPKGTPIRDWISTERAKCKNCGCYVKEGAKKMIKELEEKTEKSLTEEVQELKEQLQAWMEK